MHSAKKSCLAATIILYLTVIFCGHSQPLSYPKHDEVVEYFFNNYSLADYSKPSLEFQKKPSGWFGKISDNGRDTLIKIWSSGEWFAAKALIDDTSATFSALRKSNMDNWAKIHYDACPYYGYNDWYKDIIKDYRDYNGNDAEKIYGIGRAYSFYADNLLSDKNGSTDSTVLFSYKNPDSKLSAGQLSTYRFYRHKAIELYSKTVELKPSYKTLVGEINLKRDFEYITAYQDLIQFSTAKQALNEIPDSLFSPFYREFAYNLLMSCDKNAILFVNGDLDTFLPLYLQLKEGIRKDVAVINAGMLALPRYCAYLKKYFRVKFSLQNSNPDPNTLAYVYLEKDTMNLEWTFDDVITYLNDPAFRKTYNELTYSNLPANHFNLSGLYPPLRWSSDARYLYKYQLLIADVINSNLKNRPVYFSTTNASENYDGYENYFSTAILVYQVLNQYQLIQPYYENINTEKGYRLATGVFQWQHAGSASSHEKVMCTNYRVNLGRLALRLAEESKFDSSMKIIDLCLDLFGNDQLAHTNLSLPLVEAFYKMKQYESGNHIAKQIVYNFRHDIYPVDDDIIKIKEPKNEKLIVDVRELMKEYGQDVSILDEK
ncbi:MAG: hypothetical protein ACHQNT_13180 [Bacteroidia bacterium]